MRKITFYLLMFTLASTSTFSSFSYGEPLKLLYSIEDGRRCINFSGIYTYDNLDDSCQVRSARNASLPQSPTLTMGQEKIEFPERGLVRMVQTNCTQLEIQVAALTQPSSEVNIATNAASSSDLEWQSIHLSFDGHATGASDFNLKFIEQVYVNRSLNKTWEHWTHVSYRNKDTQRLLQIFNKVNLTYRPAPNPHTNPEDPTPWPDIFTSQITDTYLINCTFNPVTNF